MSHTREAGLERISCEPRWGSMVPDFILERAKQLQEAIGEPQSKEQWLQRHDQLRKRLLHSLGLDPLPERGALNTRVTGILKRNGYQIEKVIYEARPGFPVAAHLYVPSKQDRPCPAVVHAPGHWMDNAKLEADLQLFCVGMVKQGFVVLIYDPIGQGERRTNWHNHGQFAQLLVGLDQTGLLVWEASRAVDYLISRPEVDPKRIGFTGASGGGQMAAFTPVVDERIATSVSVCFSDTYFHLLTALRGWNWNGGVDLCNQIPRIVSYARLSDILGMHAPRPFLMINGTLDSMFPIQGAREVFGQVQRIYNLLGSNDVATAEVESPHGYDQKMREIAYGWFVQKLKGDGEGKPIPEQPAKIEPLPYPIMYLNATADPSPDKAQTFERNLNLEVFCFDSPPDTNPDPKILDLVKARAEKLPPFMNPPANLTNWSKIQDELKENVKKVLGPLPLRWPMGPSFIGGEWDPAHVQITHRERLSYGWAERVLIDSEAGILLPGVFIYPDQYKTGHPVVVLLHDLGKEDALYSGISETFVKSGTAVFTLDLRGTGESRSTEFENVTTSWMLERDWFSWQVWDITRAIDYLSERSVTGIQHDKQRITVWGKGLSALEAIYAAAIDPRIAGVVAERAPVSYKSLLTLYPNYPIGAYVFDVLNFVEVAQVASLVAPRPFLLVNPVDGLMNPVSQNRVEDEFTWCRMVYKLFGDQADNFAALLNVTETTERTVAWIQQNVKR